MFYSKIFGGLKKKQYFCSVFEKTKVYNFIYNQLFV